MAIVLGGVRVTARPVLKVKSDGIAVIEYPKQYPQSRPVNGPAPSALADAAWYLGGVLCEQNDHVHEYGCWPCQESLAFAEAGIHQLSQYKFPLQKEASDGTRKKKERKKSESKSGRKSGRKSSG